MEKTYYPRNDFVLIQQVDRGQTAAGIQLPDRAEAGMDHMVRAVGPDVTGLDPGDYVLIVGTVGQDLIYLPDRSDLLLTKQANVVVRIEAREVADAG